LTAQRLLVEKQDRSAVEPLKKLAKESATGQGRVHALWTLHGLGSLTDLEIQRALDDSVSGVREQALRLAEERLATSDVLGGAVIRLADDSSPRVRFQLAFTLGEYPGAQRVKALARIARQDISDPWTQIAVLSSCGKEPISLLELLVQQEQFTTNAGTDHLRFLSRLANLVGSGTDDRELARAMGLLAKRTRKTQPWQLAVLAGLGQGMQIGRLPMASLWASPPAGLAKYVPDLKVYFEGAKATVADTTAGLPERVNAAQLLGHGPYSIAAEALKGLISPHNPAELQLAGVRALSAHDDPSIADILLAAWNSSGPSTRREIVEAMFARTDRLGQLLQAIEDKKILAGQIEPFRLNQLRKHSNQQIREKALSILAGQVAVDRQRVVDAFRPALELKADLARGKAVFKRVCATCHRLEEVGTEVGPDLLSALKTKTREGLLVDLFDPSREVDPRFINYVVSTKTGRFFSGIIAVETASSVTLRRAERAEDTILRDQIEEIQATAKSLMPEDLEKQLSQQDVADVITYLLRVAGVN
jgi:putative heme-binding domain-containing protein